MAGSTPTPTPTPTKGATMKYLTAEDAVMEVYRRNPDARRFGDRLEAMMRWAEVGYGDPYGDHIKTRLAVVRVAGAWPLKGNVIVRRESDDTTWHLGLRGPKHARKWSARPVGL